jgi:predicted transglutaminase-like cysteine proteinase
MMRASLILTCAILTAASISGAVADGTTMEMAGVAYPPPAFKSFCAREKSLCSTNGARKVVELTPARNAELSKINTSVNSRIAERSDLETTGKADDWRLPGKAGDCEDFAILKKRELLKRGWPASVLLLTVARSGGEGHTVLTVRTNQGDLVLDNWTSAVRDWSRTPYRYFARQSQTNGRQWQRIGSARPL